MTSRLVTSVPVARLGFGRVRLGWERPIPAGGVALPVHGALITVDPARPDALPSCLVTDPAAASVSVRELYGVDAEVALLQVWSDGAPATAECSVDVGEGLRAMTQLGIVQWCRLHSPLPTDDLLLELEELTLVGRSAHVLDTEQDWATELERICGQVVEQARGRVDAHPAVQVLLSDALELLATTLAVSDPISIQARQRLLEDGSQKTLRTRTRGAWIPDRSQPLALVAGAAGQRGTATVDWDDVGRGDTSMSEGNVRWRVELAEALATFAVEVEGPSPIRSYAEAAPGTQSPLANSLAFEVYLPDWPFAVVAGGLRFDSSRWLWCGQARFGAAQADLFREASGAGKLPIVRVRGMELSPAQNPGWSAAHRWTCRGIASARVDSGIEGRTAAVGAWRHAAGLWRLVGHEANGDECDRLAADLIAGEVGYDLTVAEAWLVDAD